MPLTQSEIVVGLDIGTTKVGTVIASSDGKGGMAVIGVGVVPSRGIKRGVVVDVEDTVAAIKESVERAAHMAGVKVERAVVGITGDHIQSFNSRGTVTVSSQGGIITRHDVERVLQAAALEVPRDREIIHSLPRDFIVDGHPGVKRPIGMAGQHLEVETHIVTGRGTFLQNTVQCVEKVGLRVEALVLEPIATAEAVTTFDERDMGVILIDIGGGTSDIAVFMNGSIVYSGVLPVGGNHVTRDIAIGLRTPFELAEKLKLDSGAATRDMIPHGEALEVLMAGSGEKLRIPRSLLGEIIEARMSELFELARQMMHDAGMKMRLPGGVIVAGGGSLLPGAIELGVEIFQMPTRLGMPRDISGWSDQVATPQLATGVGLCRFALTQRSSPGNQTEMPALASFNERKVWGGMSHAPQVKEQQQKTNQNQSQTSPSTVHSPANGDVTASEARPVNETEEAEFTVPKFEVRREVTSQVPRVEAPRAEPIRAEDFVSTPVHEETKVSNNTVAKTELEVKKPVIDALSDLRQNLAQRDSAFRKAHEERNKFEADKGSRQKNREELFSRADLSLPSKPAEPTTWGKIWVKLKEFLGFEEEKKDL
jgi:cell division protein FtsA